jgi:hypothetical protein
MPEQPATLDEWMRLHAPNTQADNQDPTWVEKLKRIRARAEAEKTGSLQKIASGH